MLTERLEGEDVVLSFHAHFSPLVMNSLFVDLRSWSKERGSSCSKELFEVYLAVFVCVVGQISCFPQFFSVRSDLLLFCLNHLGGGDDRLLRGGDGRLFL